MLFQSGKLILPFLFSTLSIALTVSSFVCGILKAGGEEFAVFRAKLAAHVEAMFSEVQDADAMLLQELFDEIDGESDVEEIIPEESDGDVEEMNVEHVGEVRNAKGAGRRRKSYSDSLSTRTLKSRFQTLNELIEKEKSILLPTFLLAYFLS